MIILQLIFAMTAVYFSASIFHAPKRLSKYIALIGGIGWLCYLYFSNSYDQMVATYLSSFFIALLSHLAAIFFKIPVTVFFIPSYFPLVPGATMYQSVYSYIMGDFSAGNSYLLETIFIAIMIALAIFTADSLFRIYFLIRSKLIAKNVP